MFGHVRLAQSSFLHQTGDGYFAVPHAVENAQAGWLCKRSESLRNELDDLGRQGSPAHSSPRLADGAQPASPNRPSTRSSGQNPVKLD